MIRGTSVPVTMTIEDADLTGATNVRAIIKQNTNVIEKTVTPTISSGVATIVMPLTIAETLTLSAGRALVQVVWVNSDGYKDATVAANIDILQILKEEAT